VRLVWLRLDRTPLHTRPRVVSRTSFTGRGGQPDERAAPAITVAWMRCSQYRILSLGFAAMSRNAKVPKNGPDTFTIMPKFFDGSLSQ